jgi:hypothetical protein
VAARFALTDVMPFHQAEGYTLSSASCRTTILHAISIAATHGETRDDCHALIYQPLQANGQGSTSFMRVWDELHVATKTDDHGLLDASAAVCAAVLVRSRTARVALHGMLRDQGAADCAELSSAEPLTALVAQVLLDVQGGSDQIRRRRRCAARFESSLNFCSH